MNNNSLSIFQRKIKLSDSFNATYYYQNEQNKSTSIKSKFGFLMISLKNKKFTKNLLDVYADLTKNYFSGGFITIVDSPYIYNLKALGLTTVEFSNEMKKINKIYSENESRVQKLLRKNHDTNLKYITWSALESKVPHWLIDEIRVAFMLKGKFHQDVLDRTVETLPMHLLEKSSPEKFAMFLLKELPTLLYLYYLFEEQICDVYPGENPELLWKIESGYYFSELPLISKLIKNHQGISYIDLQELR